MVSSSVTVVFLRCRRRPPRAGILDAIACGYSLCPRGCRAVVVIPGGTRESHSSLFRLGCPGASASPSRLRPPFAPLTGARFLMLGVAHPLAQALPVRGG